MRKLFILLALALCACTSEKDLVIVGHRGAAHLAPENTVAAMEAGIAAGADMVEIDIQLSKDGYIVVCHDDTVDRTTNGSGAVSSLLWDEIKALNIKDSKGNITELKMPSMDQIFDCVKGKAGVLIEIKSSDSSLPGIEQACVDMIREYKMEQDVIIQSFDYNVLRRAHEIAPELRYEFLLYMPWEGLNIEGYTIASSINIFYEGAAPEFVNAVHAVGKEVKVWTLDEYREEIVALVDGVITDNPSIFTNRK